MKKEMQFFQGVAKLLHVLQERGVQQGHLMAAANHADKADSLATFLKAGCAQITMVQIAEKPARGTFLCSEAFVTKPGRYIYDSFRDRIAPAYPKRLRRRSIKKVKYHDLEKSSYDIRDIIPSLGGMDKVRANAFRPDELDSLIEAQAAGPNDQKGLLLTNGFANIFYCVGISDELFVVCVNWFGDKWVVDAYTLDGVGIWLTGYRVFRKH